MTFSVLSITNRYIEFHFYAQSFPGVYEWFKNGYCIKFKLSKLDIRLHTSAFMYNISSIEVLVCG